MNKTLWALLIAGSALISSCEEPVENVVIATEKQLVALLDSIGTETSKWVVGTYTIWGPDNPLLAIREADHYHFVLKDGGKNAILIQKWLDENGGIEIKEIDTSNWNEITFTDTWSVGWTTHLELNSDQIGQQEKINEKDMKENIKKLITQVLQRIRRLIRNENQGTFI
jgi:hypothetical protein